MPTKLVFCFKIKKIHCFKMRHWGVSTYSTYQLGTSKTQSFRVLLFRIFLILCKKVTAVVLKVLIEFLLFQVHGKEIAQTEIKYFDEKKKEQVIIESLKYLTGKSRSKSHLIAVTLKYVCYGLRFLFAFFVVTLIAFFSSLLPCWPS